MNEDNPDKSRKGKTKLKREINANLTFSTKEYLQPQVS